MKKLTTDISYAPHPLFWIVLIIRVLSAFSILIHPLWGTLTFLITDYFDSWIWVHLLRMSLKTYHKVDKIIDFLGYLSMLVVSQQEGQTIFVILLMLFLYRLIGFGVYLRVHRSFIFLLFPNFFEVVFFWFVLAKYVSINPYAPANKPWLIVLIAAKEIQEFWIHYPGKLPFRTFGVPLPFRLLGYRKKPNIGY